ncbi:patatin [Clostridium tertium]|uniref:Sporulation hydrolase CotR n=1 Tax=Clostridium tertium TaxID=1559 RepID=A0A6N3FIN3_9CLOT
MKKFRILAFDGGGVKGALSLEILNNILKKFPNFLDNIDLFTGTSTGSIIATLLAKGYDLKSLNHLYSEKEAKKIFSQSSLNLIRPKYKNNNLKDMIEDYFPKNFLISDFKKYIFIPAFYLGDEKTISWYPKFFSNLPKSKTRNTSVIDAILASSAAPTFFPSHKGYIDGGVIANSPTAVTILSILESMPSLTSKDIVLLSIGTGDSPERISGKTNKWGIIQWSFHPFSKMKSPLLSLLMDGMSSLEDLYSKEILKDNYFRINPKVPKFIQLDNYKLIFLLRQIGKSANTEDLYKFIENIYLK